jgi:hypothetical protein
VDVLPTKSREANSSGVSVFAFETMIRVWGRPAVPHVQFCSDGRIRLPQLAASFLPRGKRPHCLALVSRYCPG